MDLYYQLTYWLFLPQVWVIVSLFFIGLEVTDGSAIFFLPMGISAALIASLIFLVDNSVLPLHFLPTTWYWLLACWAVVSVMSSLGLATVRKQKKEGDINNY
jgi:membrane protein implicated in regulation of membrane protease activity